MIIIIYIFLYIYTIPYLFTRAWYEQQDQTVWWEVHQGALAVKMDGIA